MSIQASSHIATIDRHPAADGGSGGMKPCEQQLQSPATQHAFLGESLQYLSIGDLAELGQN